MVDFLTTILTTAFDENYPLHIREIERIAHVLAEGNPADNEQVNPWDVVVIAANGDVTTFSPEFMELKSAPHNNFCFGNLLENDFDEIRDSATFNLTYKQVRTGVELCRTTCHYFGVCGGGAPSNKMTENNSLVSAETNFCRLSTQAAADALLQFIQSRELAGRLLNNENRPAMRQLD